MKLDPYVIIADESVPAYLLVNLDTRRVVHTTPAAIWHVLQGLLSPANVPPPSTSLSDSSQPQLQLCEEPKPNHVDVG